MSRCLYVCLLLSVESNDVSGRSQRPVAAGAAEFTTYDVTEVLLYADDGQRLDATETMVR